MLFPLPYFHFPYPFGASPGLFLALHRPAINLAPLTPSPSSVFAGFREASKIGAGYPRYLVFGQGSRVSLFRKVTCAFHFFQKAWYFLFGTASFLFDQFADCWILWILFSRSIGHVTDMPNSFYYISVLLSHSTHTTPRYSPQHPYSYSHIFPSLH